MNKITFVYLHGRNLMLHLYQIYFTVGRHNYILFYRKGTENDGILTWT